MEKKISPSILNKIIWMLTVFMVAAIPFIQLNPSANYLFWGCAILVFALSFVASGNKISLTLEPHYIFFGIFLLVALMTSLWAIEPTLVIERAWEIFKMTVCFSFIYMHYKNTDEIGSLLNAIRWGGYVVVIYSFVYWGADTILAATTDLRLPLEIANTNTLGLAAALSCLLQANQIFTRQKHAFRSSLMLIPSILLIAATQSRKALILWILGTIILLIVRSLKRKNMMKAIGIAGVAICVSLALLMLLSRVPMFSGILERMKDLLLLIDEDAIADDSTVMRLDLMSLGWQTFLENPLGGIGIGNASVLASQQFNFDAYLHNNYIELLSGGGIIGFVSYYAAHVYLLGSLIRYRNGNKNLFALGLTWIIMILLMDYGMVSYYSKSQILYLTVLFLIVNQLKKQFRSSLNVE